MPFRFDAAALHRDVAAIGEHYWQPHFNSSYYTGDWSGAALRSSGGAVALYAEPAGAVFEDTPLLAACPAIAAALRAFRCPLNAVRLLRLGPGARVKEHRDYGLEYGLGEARFHVPVCGEGAEFFLNRTPVVMRPGECWYVDVDSPHSVANGTSQSRVHLVIDAVVDPWLEGMMNDAASRV